MGTKFNPLSGKFDLVNDKASDIEAEELSAATYDDVQDFINFFGDRTLLSGGTITATSPADGTVAIAACTAWCKESDSETAIGRFFNYAGKADQALTDNSVNAIYLDYNGGTPQIVVATNYATYGFQHDHILVGAVYRQGTATHIFQSANIGIGGINRSLMHQVEHHGAHRGSGMVTSSTGTRQLIVTEGILYAGLTRKATSAFNTSTGGTFSYWYYDGDAGPAVWVEVTEATQISRTQYNALATGLANLSTNRYGVHWVYLDIEGAHLHVVYGQDNYVANQAEEASVPSTLPPIVTGYCLLIAKIICQEGTDTLTITYPWTTAFTSSLATDHGSLGGLTHDDHVQYIKDSEFTAADEVIVGTGSGTFGQVTLAASQFLAKKAAGAATNVTAAEARTILNVFTADGAQSFENLLYNGDFEIDDPPDGWTSVLAGGSTFDRSNTQYKINSYSAKLVRGTGNCYAYQDVSDYARYKSRNVTTGCWVYATVASRARISINDGVAQTFSSYHTGGSTWEWLTLTFAVDASATMLRKYIVISNGATTCYFDGAILVEGDKCPAYTDKSAMAGWTASRALQTSAGGLLQVSPVTLAQLNYLADVTSLIQAQLNAKLEDVEDDTSPVLGGDFNANFKKIYGVGPLALASPTILTISSGEITVTRSFHRVDTGGGASENLDTISGGIPGQILILKPANDARTIVVRHNIDNIWLQGKANITLDDISDGLMLVYSVEDTKWFDISPLGAGGNGDVATDSIWDAAGDIVQGTGADTAAKLAIGTAGQRLKVNAGETALEYANPGWELLEDYTFSSQGQDHTLAGLDGDNDGVYMIITYVVYNAVAGSLYIQPNADTTANIYDHQWLLAHDTTIAADWLLNRAGLWAGWYGPGCTVGFSPGMYLYAKSGSKRMWMGYAHSDFYTDWASGLWYSVLARYNDTSTNITSLLFHGAAANFFGAGSRIITYRKAR